MSFYIYEVTSKGEKSYLCEITDTSTLWGAKKDAGTCPTKGDAEKCVLELKVSAYGNPEYFIEEEV
jgi:hypothetical protein